MLATSVPIKLRTILMSFLLHCCPPTQKNRRQRLTQQSTQESGVNVNDATEVSVATSDSGLIPVTYSSTASTVSTAIGYNSSCSSNQRIDSKSVECDCDRSSLRSSSKLFTFRKKNKPTLQKENSDSSYQTFSSLQTSTQTTSSKKCAKSQQHMDHNNDCSNNNFPSFRSSSSKTSGPTHSSSWTSKHLSTNKQVVILLVLLLSLHFFVMKGQIPELLLTTETCVCELGIPTRHNCYDCSVAGYSCS